jgi:hypothetical protein
MNIEEEILLSDAQKTWALTTKNALAQRTWGIIVFSASPVILPILNERSKLQQYRMHLENSLRTNREITRITCV